MNIKNIIEIGIQKLESIYEVKWPTSHLSKLTRDMFKEALLLSYKENIPLYKAAGYSFSNGLTTATQKIIIGKTNIRRWKYYILELAEHKQCIECLNIKNEKEFSKGANKCKHCASKLSQKHHKENRKEILEKNYLRRKITVLHIIDVMIREGKIKETECQICGYKENWAALDFHHINTELERPKWAKGKNPSEYIIGKNIEIAEKRYLYEMDNLVLICTNCHTDIHAKSKRDATKGVKEYLGDKYTCEVCDKKDHLHLHHKDKDKNYSFHDFLYQSKEKIINNELLEQEMKKDVSILCGNHHREIHHPNWELPL